LNQGLIRFTRLFASKRTAKFGVFFIVFGTSLFSFPESASAACVNTAQAATIAAAAEPTAQGETPTVTTLATCGGDDVSYQVPITTAITYDGVQYDRVYATTNSVITFGQPDGTYWTYPATPSISIQSMDWVVYPNQRNDEHLIISSSDGGFQVDLSARPIFLQSAPETTNIVITAAINTDGTVAISYVISGADYSNYNWTRTGARLNDGTVVTLEEASITRVEEAPVLTPEPVPSPSPTPSVEPSPSASPSATALPSPTPSASTPMQPSPTASPAPTQESSPSPSPLETLEPSPTPTQEPSATASPIVVEPPAPSPVPQPAPAPAPEPVPQPAPVPAPAPVVIPDPVPVVQPEPAPEPAPEPPAVEPEPPVVAPEPPVVAPEPPAPAPEPAPELAPVPVEPAPEPAPVPVEPAPVPAPEPIPAPVPVAEPAPAIAPSYENPVAIGSVDVATLPPDTPVELENGVILTAEVVVALTLLENPSELISAIFTDPGQALMALANVGADMSPEVREKAQNTVLASIIAGGIATQSAVTAAGAAAYRRNP